MRVRLRRQAAIIGATVAALLAAAVPTMASNTGKPAGPPKPTVVLVHGAWTDSSSWLGSSSG